jgi:PPOX class probable F420-dependent enzyme
MALTPEQRQFIASNRAAAMITLRADGTPAAVRVGIALVDGKLWSSGTQERARTRALRRDPRCTLFVYEAQGFGYLTIEARVTILEGGHVPQQSLSLFRVMQNRPTGPLAWSGNPSVAEDDFLKAMVDEHRLIYEFEPLRAYGS